jgi:hypothetical protein
MFVQYGKQEKHLLRKEWGPALTIEEHKKNSLELMMWNFQDVQCATALLYMKRGTVLNGLNQQRCVIESEIYI